MPANERPERDRGGPGPARAGRRRAVRPGDGSGAELPGAGADDRDEGWSDSAAARDLDWYRRERPPHHG